MSAQLRSVPSGSAAPAGSPVHDPLRERSAGVRNGIVYFAHLARLSLPLADLDDRQASEMGRDLAVLVAEATRDRLRPHLLHALLDAVLDELLPALPPPSRTALHEARPLLSTPSDTAS